MQMRGAEARTGDIFWPYIQQANFCTPLPTPRKSMTHY